MGAEESRQRPQGEAGGPAAPLFGSQIVDRIRAAGNIWRLPGGEILLPEVFGFCRGVERALTMLQGAVSAVRGKGGRLILLGQIIHNPWVNEQFRRQGVGILSADQVDRLEANVGAGDCAVIPAFGVPLAVRRRLKAIGCRTVDTTCPDVRRLWAWAEKAARAGYGVLILGRADHDETVVTRSRLEDIGGRYVVVGGLEHAGRFCDLVCGRCEPRRFGEFFPRGRATNADSLEPFGRLAQVSQTTMLYDQTLELRELLRGAYAERFGPEGLDGPRGRLAFQPTVCRATQARQTAAVELCRLGCDLVIVVGGFGSSNTRHLYELARRFGPAWLIEDADAIRSGRELHTMDFASGEAVTVTDWLPARRPLRIGVLAGASSPEIVVGLVLQRLGEFLARP